MNTRQEAPSCERKADLIDYLYDEMPRAQRTQFAAHLQACLSCRDELTGFEQVRGELRSWDLEALPRVEVVIPRGKLEVLKELLSLFPLWSRGLLGVATATACVLLALGTVSLLKTGNAERVALQMPPATAPAVAPTAITPVAVSAALTPELKQLVNSEIARALTAERQALQAQLATLETRNQEHRTQLQAVTRQLRDLQTRHQQLLAAQQPSLRSIFAEYEPSSER